MRIISGIYKSRSIRISKSGFEIRPTTDRARETLFNILEHRYDLKSEIVFDLFCGSGSFGIECLSRGVGKSVFVDIQTGIVTQNIETLKIDNEKFEVIKSDVIKFLKNNTRPAYLIFADPPYDYKSYGELINAVSDVKSYFILEHSSKLKEFDNFNNNIILQKKIGISQFTFFNFKV